MEHDLAAVVRRYDEVWAERDVGRRREILAAIWTDDTLYVDPDALVDFIEASFEQYPGLAITAISEVAVLHDRASYRWRQTSANGEALEGTDFIEFDAAGRIQRLTGFYDS
jgi:SnoaL-like domain